MLSSCDPESGRMPIRQKSPAMLTRAMTPPALSKASSLLLGGEPRSHERRFLDSGLLAAGEYSRPFHQRLDQDQRDHYDQGPSHNRVETVIEDQANICSRAGSQLRGMRQEFDARIGVKDLVP